MGQLRHVQNRQTAHLADLGDVEIEKRLDALVSSFGEQWLERHGAEPLQKLWSRRDGLATSQLVLIGDALLSLSAIDPKWVRKQAQAIKSADHNRRRGAMFELLGLNLFGASAVKPTPRDSPGYDAVVTVPDGAKFLSRLRATVLRLTNGLSIPKARKQNARFSARRRTSHFWADATSGGSKLPVNDRLDRVAGCVACDPRANELRMWPTSSCWRNVGCGDPPQSATGGFAA